MKKYKSISIILATILLTGCSVKTKYLDQKEKESAQYASLGIDSIDFEKAADNAAQSLIQSNALNKPGGKKFVIAMGNITNDTTQMIDTDMLTKRIRVAILNSNKAVFSTAIGADGASDETTHIVRSARGNDEFKQSTIAKKGTLLAPELSLSGKILQRRAQIDSRKQVVDYYFQLSLTDISSGVAIWENESKISKVGSNDSVTW